MAQTNQQDQSPPSTGPQWLEQACALLALLLVASIGWLTFTLQPSAGDTSQGLAPREMASCVMDKDGYLRGALYGAVREELAWEGASMACDGMPRPEGTGIRLAFREHADADTPGLMLVIGIEDMQPGDDIEERPANVTLNDQRIGRFFSTQGEENCWVSMTDQIQLRGTVEQIWRFDGILYCAGALPNAAGDGSITLGELEFSGQIRLE